MEVEGTLADGRTSAVTPARLLAGADGMLRVTTATEALEVPLAEASISERVGSIPRRIRFPGGAVFETRDNDAVDALLAAHGPVPWSHRVAQLESRWVVALGALAAMAIVVVLMMTKGMPWLAGVAARLMPPQAEALLGRQGLEALDRFAFSPSELPPERQEDLAALFAGMTRPLNDGHEYRLELRGARGTGPNAFALPGGIVIITDELVELTQSNDELAAVLAHEVGHVRGQHGLRMLLQSVGVSAIAIAVLGDASQVSVLAGAVPGLVQAAYSRDFEREADGFAREWLAEHGRPAASLDALLCRLDAARGTASGAAGFLSTHPPTSERARCDP